MPKKAFRRRPRRARGILANIVEGGDRPRFRDSCLNDTDGGEARRRTLNENLAPLLIRDELPGFWRTWESEKNISGETSFTLKPLMAMADYLLTVLDEEP